MINNPNTRSFWNNKLMEKFGSIVQSPIYIDKLDIVLRHLSKKEGKLLDVGVGYGYLETRLVEKASGLKLFGIDTSTFAINGLKEKIPGTFLVSTAKKLPFRSNIFENVTILDVLEHFNLNDCEKILYEIRRVMKKGGDLIVSVPVNESWRDKRLNNHLISFSKSMAMQLLAKSGFKIIKISELTAFKTNYKLKKFINKIIPLRHPNLVIIFTIKV